MMPVPGICERRVEWRLYDVRKIGLVGGCFMRTFASGGAQGVVRT